MLPPDLRNFVKVESWTYSKTMPKWPHEYIVREQVNDSLFVSLVQHIRANGYQGMFYQTAITYFEEGGLVYWTMGAPVGETTIVNRCKREDTYQYRLANGTLPLP